MRLIAGYFLEMLTTSVVWLNSKQVYLNVFLVINYLNVM